MALQWLVYSVVQQLKALHAKIKSYHCFTAESWYLQSTAAVQSLLWICWSQSDLRIWLSSHFDIFLYFSVGEWRRKWSEKNDGEEKNAETRALSWVSYLARWSTASTTLVPSLALVSQNKAPYACKQRTEMFYGPQIYLDTSGRQWGSINRFLSRLR